MNIVEFVGILWDELKRLFEDDPYEPFIPPHSPYFGKKPEVGDVLPDGWIYMGASPHRGQKNYSLEPVELMISPTTWDKATQHAKKLRQKGHNGAHITTLWELDDIFDKVARCDHNDNSKAQFSTKGTWWTDRPSVNNAGCAEVAYHQRNRWHSNNAPILNKFPARCARYEP